MTDSDSSEDENLKLLQEAVDRDFISDSLYNNTIKEIKEPEKPKSLRVSKYEDNTDNNLLNFTPGVQNFVAKQLENFLETSLNEQLTDTIESSSSKKRKRPKDKVRLFSDSEHFINLKDQHLEVVNNNKPKVKTDFDSEDEEKIKLVLVEPEDILSKKEVSNWPKSTRTKQIFRYKRSGEHSRKKSRKRGKTVSVLLEI